MDEITLTRAEPSLGPAQQGPASYRPDISLSEEKGDSGLVSRPTRSGGPKQNLLVMVGTHSPVLLQGFERSSASNQVEDP